MSERDPLAEAFAALREETAPARDAGERAAATRRALLLATSSAQRRSKIIRLVLPLAAALAATAAWAAASGRLERMFGSEGEHARSGEVVPPPSSSIIAAPLVPEEEDAGVADAAFVAETPEDAGTRVVRSMSAPSASATRAARDASVESPSVNPEEAPYQTAHDADFVARDWPRGLAAWDSYLAAHPNGRLAPEARYNRSLVLLRLGRSEDARTALRPFAEGSSFHGYRQKEAIKLLDAIDRGEIRN